MNRVAFMVFRLLELLMAAVGIFFLADVATIGAADWMLVWLAIAVVYLGVGAIALWRRAAELDAGRASVGPHVGGGALALFDRAVPILSSAVGVAAAVLAAFFKKADADIGWVKEFYIWATALVILASWAMLHIGFARVYQDAWHRSGGLEFPGTKTPALIDFTYFSFAIGTAFAVSDVQTTSRTMRSRVLTHSAWSFIYNTAIVAFAIGAITNR